MTKLQKLFHPLWRLKEIYLDKLDPRAEVFLLATKTALAAILTLLIFQHSFGNIAGIWAALASYFIVQTDINTETTHRFRFLLGTVISFILLASYGCFIGQYSKIGFSLSMLVIAFIAGWLHNLSIKLWNAAIWGLVVFLFAGSIAWPTFTPIQIGLLFLGGGVIAILLCLLLPQRLNAQNRFEIYLSQLLHKLNLFLETAANTHRDHSHYEKILMQNIQSQPIEKNDPVFQALLLKFYKLYILSKSLVHSYTHVTTIETHYNLLLKEGLMLAAQHCEQLRQSILKNTSPAIQKYEIAHYQQEFEQLRQKIIAIPHADMTALMRYSDCFSKFKLLMVEIDLFSQDLMALRSKEQLCK